MSTLSQSHQIRHRTYKIFVILYNPCLNRTRLCIDPVRSLLSCIVLVSMHRSGIDPVRYLLSCLNHIRSGIDQVRYLISCIIIAIYRQSGKCLQDHWSLVLDYPTTIYLSPDQDSLQSNVALAQQYKDLIEFLHFC